MIDFERLDNKRFAYSCLAILNEKSCLNEVEIRILTSEDECKRLFCCSKFPILSEVPLHGALEDADCYDDHGRQRFYKDKIFADGRAFVVSNHWYGPGKSMPDNRTPFLQWVLEKTK
jgi:hypothetical protein